MAEERRQKSAQQRAKFLAQQRSQKQAEEFHVNDWSSLAELEEELKILEDEMQQEEVIEKKKNKRKNKVKTSLTGDQDGDNTVGDDVENGTGNGFKLAADCDENEEIDPEESDFYCIACDKAFKSVMAFQNHENSKKHKQNLARLKEIMESDQQRSDS